MNKIHLLDNGLINKIAAGEVVERPASVVKELMENSIDAGATSITVEIAEGGTSVIKITDNGKGIPKDEIRTAFMRHATSKIDSFEDLENVLTLGFRGEALSSIASVAQVEMLTRTENDPMGTRIIINGGIVDREEECAANVGTVFYVKNIFFNTPARRKFLKKPATEGSYISEIVNRIALGHPNIAIKYINNGNIVLQTNGDGNIKNSLFYIYGKDIASKMLSLESEKEGYRLKGLVGKPELSRGNRNYENFFINGRFIKSTLVQNAVEDAYKNKIMIGKFPVFALNLIVPSNTVDVNVHPTKLEVRFSDENFIYDLIYNAVLKVLKAEELIPEVTWDKPVKEKKAPVVQMDLNDVKPEIDVNKAVEVEKTPLEVIEKSADFVYDNKGITIDSVPKPKERDISLAETPVNSGGNNIAKAMEILYGKEVANPEKYGISARNEKEKYTEIDITKYKTEPEVKKRKAFFTNYKIVGQLFSTYWIVEQGEDMYLIDQHAAHERVLFEKFTKDLKEKKTVSQLLLQPVVVALTDREKVIVEENRELLESFGFEFEQFGEKAYAIRSVPWVFNEDTRASFFTDIVDALGEKHISNIYDTKADEIAMMSCKAAVKGNDKLSYSEAQALIQELLKLEDPFTCPHGRPTIIKMSKYELEKKFKRIQD